MLEIFHFTVSLVYSGFVPDFIPTSVEQGLIEELVELLEVESDDDITMVRVMNNKIHT